MTLPLVSIIIPVYNCERHLSETIESALGQTWDNKEVIIVDDGSTDNSLEIARSFERHNVRVLSQTNKGASAARNHGLKKAQGEYIQFLDADDLLLANKIEEQIKILIQNPEKLAVCPTIYFNGTPPNFESLRLNPVDPTYYDPFDFLINMYGSNIINKGFRGITTIHSWLSPRRILDKAGEWNEQLTVDDDGEYFCRVCLASSGILDVPYVFNFYRKYQNGNSLSSTNSYSAVKSCLLANKLKLKYLQTARTRSSSINLVMSRVFKENSVSAYPQYFDIHKECERMLHILGGTSYTPILGGPLIEFLKTRLGWKTARMVQYIINSIKQRLQF